MAWEVDPPYPRTSVKAANLGGALGQYTDLQKGEDGHRALPVQSLDSSPKPILLKLKPEVEAKKEKLTQAGPMSLALFQKEEVWFGTGQDDAQHHLQFASRQLIGI